MILLIFVLLFTLHFTANKTAVDSELALPPEVNSCLHALLTYLRDFNLHNVLKLKR